ncbi:hypothetical protein EQW78_04200 [Oerskovia turbata]|uniref:Uncharacterized protein n=1 Tax=Oerskovia turbata TaxID=1713 RepID=A0A4Q1L230_9CELL|nr:hypothetical protein [Oerskovia turbata]RXR28012.1 hypothetical protein EQW73_01555 [Oerskovia turbata]RXR35979.1 hypothetical protein EQW78_04200 [Oerskovia turbata]TGJ94893.1 hypothetical protein DLJ96_17855 [Actinotalea fermentans ATCC 43279 = JCM 9966 = DSM 3133]
MLEQRRDELRSAYLRLGTGELAAAGVFATAALTVVAPRLAAPRDQAALWSALVPLLLVLVQAGTYWLLARTWVGRAPMPAAVAVTYRALRALTAGALAAGLIGVVVWWPRDVTVMLLVAGVWGFAAAEYVNYYVVRLAYPVRQLPAAVRQPSTPRLVQDLRSARPLGRAVRR